MFGKLLITIDKLKDLSIGHFFDVCFSIKKVYS